VIPWAAIARVATEDRSLPSSMWVLQPEDTPRGLRLNVAVSGRVNLHLELHDELRVRTTKGELVISAVSLWVDEPRETTARMRRQAAEAV